MSDREALALSSIRDAPAQSAVLARARVVLAQGTRALVADASGTLEVELEEDAPAPGTWVELDGTWSGERLIVRKAIFLFTPRADFPPSGGDFARLHAGGGQRLRLLRLRSSVNREIRSFFEARGSLEVETPLAVPSPGLDLHLAALEVRGTREPRFLITSPEYQMKRLIAGGLTRIHQITRCFRQGEEGPLHQPEFSMLEWYRGFCGADTLMRETEELVAHVAERAAGTTRIPARGREVDVAPPWERLTVAQAFMRYADAGLANILPDEELFFRILIERVEPRLGHPRPVFLVDWPASMASLARLRDGDPSVCERFEAYVDGVELCNGFGELVDPVEQRARLERDQRARAERGLEVYPIDERFLAALAEGLPPCAGNALGVDRLVMLLGGAARIDDVLAFAASEL